MNLETVTIMGKTKESEVVINKGDLAKWEKKGYKLVNAPSKKKAAPSPVPKPAKRKPDDE